MCAWACAGACRGTIMFNIVRLKTTACVRKTRTESFNCSKYFSINRYQKSLRIRTLVASDLGLLSFLPGHYNCVHFLSICNTNVKILWQEKYDNNNSEYGLGEILTHLHSERPKQAWQFWKYSAYKCIFWKLSEEEMLIRCHTTTLLQIFSEFKLYTHFIFESMRVADDTFQRNSECEWVKRWY